MQTQLLRRLGTTGCHKNKNKGVSLTMNLERKSVMHELNVDNSSNFTIFFSVMYPSEAYKMMIILYRPIL